MMNQSVLHTNWWALGLRGFTAVVFGLVTFLMPEFTLLVLVTWFGIYCLFSGVLTLVAAFRRSRHQPRWWALVLEGLTSLLAGGLALAWPGITLLLGLSLIAFWAIVTGGLQMVTAVRLRKQLQGEWMLFASGLLSVLFGVLLLLAPITGVLVVSWWVGTYAFVAGIMLCVLAFRLRRAASGVPGNTLHGAQPSPAA
jgi:uncharacterized membrane protein HdeD (DUF308 family)